ncbi:unnamed protein product [Ectocarpus sp. CCAP 1310/34]|nr:unnamed protein product [Ectocarpus sp. CCAP 1310/34]
MPRRYNEAVHKDSVGALLQRQPVGTGGNHDRRHRGGGSAVKNYRLDNRANIKEIQAQNRQARVHTFCQKQTKSTPPPPPRSITSAGGWRRKTRAGWFDGRVSSAQLGPKQKPASVRIYALRVVWPVFRGPQRREEEAAPPAEPFKLRQFKNVKSRFASEAATGTGTSQGPKTKTPGCGEKTPPASRDFLRRGTREKVATELRQAAVRRRQENNNNAAGAVTATGSKLFGATGTTYRPSTLSPPPNCASSDSGATFGGSGGSAADDRFGGGGGGGGGCGVTPRKEAVPRAGDVAQLAPRSDRDFVAANRMQVPQYLVSRREQWEREADRRKAEAPDPSCPPGMKLMPEEERLQTLRQLQENESSCQSQLNKFPLVVQTPLLQRRVDDLNKKLKEIDEAKAIFSRARVYIARDS